MTLTARLKRIGEKLQRDAERVGAPGSPIRDELAQDAATIAEAVKCIEGLPVTADGVPVVMGMRFWLLSDAEDPECEPDFEGWEVTGIGPETAGTHEHYDWVRTNGIGWITTTAMYSTRAAAEAALANRKKGKPC